MIYFEITEKIYHVPDVGYGFRKKLFDSCFVHLLINDKSQIFVRCIFAPDLNCSPEELPAFSPPMQSPYSNRRPELFLHFHLMCH